MRYNKESILNHRGNDMELKILTHLLNIRTPTRNTMELRSSNKLQIPNTIMSGTKHCHEC